MANAEKRKRPEIEPGSEIADLAMLIGTVNRISDRLQKAAATVQANTTITDWMLLRSLQSEGSLSMSDAARRVGVSRQRVHQLLKPMSEAGLLEVGEGDYGVKPLTLTDKGRELLKQLEDKFTQSLSANSGSLPSGPIRAAMAGSRRIVRAMMPKRAAVEPEDDDD